MPYKPSDGWRNINADQLHFILVEVHIEHTKPGKLFEKLTDPNAFEKYGIQPVLQLSKNYLYRLIQPDGRLGKNSINAQLFLTEWRAALADERLTHTRACIQELAKIVESSTSSNRDKIEAIKAIRSMVGEGDAAIKALEKSGVNVSITLQEEFKKFLSNE